MKKIGKFMAIAVFAAAVVVSAQHAFSGGATYTGSSLCGMCHKKRDSGVTAWEASKHSKALATLSTEEAKKISASAATDEKCLACHTTGFGMEGGYKVGGDNSKVENVGCESCHGAGSGYKGIMSKKPDIFDNGLIVPSVAVCVKCHNKTSPTYKEFHYAEAAATIRHGVEADMAKPVVQAGYTGVAKCSMCHKSRDTSVDVMNASKHINALESLKTEAAKKLSADPLNDPTCLSCHTTGYTDAGGYDAAAADDAKAKVAGVTCESCHGAGEKYAKTMKSREESLANGMIIPNEKTCRKCHNSLSPTYKDFKYEEAVKVIAHTKK